MRAIDPNDPKDIEMDELMSTTTLMKDGAFIVVVLLIFAFLALTLKESHAPAQKAPVMTDTLYVKIEPGKRTIIIVHE